MNNLDLFTKALGLTSPWYVSATELKEIDNAMELHITISFVKGGKFPSPIDKDDTNLYSAYDTKERTWRHLDFFQHKTYIHCNVPRIKTKDKKINLVEVPWARKNSGFTLLFEAYVMELVKKMTVSQTSELVREHDTRLWRIIHYYVEKAMEEENYSNVETLGIDETSKKGHNYITVFVDIINKKVIFCTNGKDSTTVDKFVEHFVNHYGLKENIKIVTCDMSLGFKKGITDNFENADTVIDKFRVIKHANEAVDAVRKEETRENDILKKTKYLWLKNKDNLTEKQKEKFESISSLNLKTSRAYNMKVTLQDIYTNCQTHEQAEEAMNKLYFWLTHSRLQPMIKFAKLLKDHINDILNYFIHPYTNAILEGVNSVIQNTKCSARGYRNDQYFIDMIYLRCGKLEFNLPSFA